MVVVQKYGSYTKPRGSHKCKCACENNLQVGKYGGKYYGAYDSNNRYVKRYCGARLADRSGRCGALACPKLARMKPPNLTIPERTAYAHALSQGTMGKPPKAACLGQFTKRLHRGPREGYFYWKQGRKVYVSKSEVGDIGPICAKKVVKTRSVSLTHKRKKNGSYGPVLDSITKLLS